MEVIKPDTITTINLGITRRSTSFQHVIQLRDGSTVIAGWTGQGTPSTLGLTATQTNYLLNRMSSSTSRTLTLRVQTTTGGSNLGGALTRTATAYVHADVKPDVSELSVSIEGNAHAKNTVKRFVQNISKVSGYFKRTAKGGASISSSKLEIRRKSGGSGLQAINSNSGTFPKILALNGQHQARGTATDSRGRSSTTGWVDLSNFDVLAYSVPQFTRFNAYRRNSVPTIIDIVRAGTHSSLSGSNTLTIRLQQRTSGTSSWTNVEPDKVATGSPFNATIVSEGYSVASSYDFRVYIVDQFGNSAEQMVTVSTQRVVLDIHKNEGVGIGKIHEQGVLDVDGSAYFHGDVEFLGGLVSKAPAVSASTPFSDYPAGISMFTSGTNEPNGFPDGYHTAVNFHGSIYRNGQIVFDHNGRNLYFRGYRGDTGWSAFTKVAGIDSGANTNGEWVVFSDGTMICRRVVTISQNVGSGGSAFSTPLPKNFPSWDGVYAGITSNSSAAQHANISSLGNVIATASATHWFVRSTAQTTTLSQQVVLFATGRLIL